MTNNTKENNNLHAGHRQRLKKHFRETSLSTFEKHQILELLLFYALPQCDTNEIAHTLINRFGSLAGVFDAPYDELIKVPGIKEHAATLLKLIPQLAQIYCSDNFEFTTTDLPTYNEIAKAFINYYIGKNNEEITAMFFDGKMRYIALESVYVGNLNSASFSSRNLIQLMTKHNPSYFVLAHNHPNALPLFSEEDIDTTQKIKSSFERLGLYLLDHFIISGNHFSSYSKETFEKTINTYGKMKTDN